MARRRYHFSLGNSTVGPVGYCASIYAESPEEALEKLKEAIAAVADGVMVTENEDDVDYIQVYFNSDAISFDDCDFDEESDEDEDDGIGNT